MGHVWDSSGSALRAAVGSSQGHYVQVRYPRGRWVTVAMEETRARAATAAATAYAALLDGRGETPSQCRVVRAAQLVREGGEREVRIAESEIARRADGKLRGFSM
jgi:hypothetical protein